ncbi:hypothetical protein B0T13DRAFT_522054 [Neurospora crassa]|nr:hypothetical protein B0T13DRAFT_522054 [Neurospora crassa]
MDNTNLPSQPPSSPAESRGSISSEDAPRGALVFLVGPVQEEIPVEVTGLREASSVFAELLAPHAMEMQGISYPGGSGLFASPLPREIALPDDDAFAMKAINYALAFPGRFIRPATPSDPAPGPSVREFLHLAVAIKKYKLQDNWFVPWPRWFEAAIDKVKANGTAQEMVWLVAAAWQLGQRRRFGKLGLDLMVKHEGRAGSYFRFCERDGGRAEGAASKVLVAWASVYDEYGWGAAVPLSELLGAVEALAEQEAASVAEECDCMGERDLSSAAVKEELKKFKREAKICVECVLMDEGSHSVENSVYH